MFFNLLKAGQILQEPKMNIKLKKVLILVTSVEDLRSKYKPSINQWMVNKWLLKQLLLNALQQCHSCIILQEPVLPPWSLTYFSPVIFNN